MKTSLLILLFFITLHAQELKIKANFFESDEAKGKTLFKGDVFIQKGYDEINASQVVIYTDKKKNPIKYIAQGDVSFSIEDEKKNRYKGKAQKVVYEPSKQIYKFYTDVYLQQVGEKKEIQGDEVFFDIHSGKASAKGVQNRPVIMVFDIKEEKK